MESKELIEGNRLIAEFMGYKFAGDGMSMHYNITKPGGQDWYFGSWLIEGFEEHMRNEIKYHSSWDWLMTAWIKFRNLNIKGEEYDQWLDGLGWYLYSSDEPILFFERLVYAIKWYNSQPV